MPRVIMRIALISFLLLSTICFVRGEEPFAAKLIEGKILGEATNKAGERLVVREFRVESLPATPGRAVGRKYYRFEYHFLGVLLRCYNTWETGDAGKVVVRWTQENKGEFSMLDGWLKVTFDRDKDSACWTRARRID